ncbi:putative DNA-binding protein, Excisionase family (Modular protein) [Nitrospira japonica]|uniref:Putative DNA-binding protein, Excisionase family (Modular protein) n=1 Tax=Nitrospira japonica TaxID=1325564 RepID=A0A1W1I5H7_9BACT|nr:helix-turn-helix domain-containing protein [Nitrospira japonica]SLM48083.1 putative DNA-binding protein, Excisionase family (Modular protein) [Nitrospira japonica]
MLTIKDLSARLNIKVSTLYAWVAQGKIPCRKIYGLIRFEPEEIDRWLTSLQPPPLSSAPCRISSPDTDIDRLIADAKRTAYTPRHGETISPSPEGKEHDDGAR